MSETLEFDSQPPKIGAVIRGEEPVTSLSFHEDGVHLFAASTKDNKLRLIDCDKGTSDSPAIKCEREGVNLVQATHHNYSVLIAGGSSQQQQENNTAAHYLSLYDNKILRSFRGHTGEITGLSMSPVDDRFLSSASDNSVRLWDLQQSGSIGKLDSPPNSSGENSHGPLHATFDSTGLVFGITASMPNNAGHLINLYDARKFSVGAFAELKIYQENIQDTIHKLLGQQQHDQNSNITSKLSSELSKAEWTSMEFNQQGNLILVTGKKGLGLLLDGYDGHVKQIYVDPARGTKQSTNESSLVACFSEDDKYVISGSDDGSVCVWEPLEARLIQKIEGHVDRINAIECNPKSALIATACTNTALWIW